MKFLLGVRSRQQFATIGIHCDVYSEHKRQSTQFYPPWVKTGSVLESTRTLLLTDCDRRMRNYADWKTIKSFPAVVLTSRRTDKTGSNYDERYAIYRADATKSRERSPTSGRMRQRDNSYAPVGTDRSLTAFTFLHAAPAIAHHYAEILYTICSSDTATKFNATSSVASGVNME